ncbi:MAG TPA: HAD family hydrolase [Nocardioidaceae bacterium]|nr:HAD family hydrolase [Nocardioidaceae bacterium]
MLKLVATDLDGTLLHSDGSVTDRTRHVLETLDERGITVVFVTGRPIRWMDDLWEHVGGHGIAICSNGGIVYDVQTHSVVEARTISREIGLKVAELIRLAIPGSVFAMEKTDGFAKEPVYRPEAEIPPGLVIGELEDVYGDNVVKLLARHDSEPPQRFWNEVEDLVGHLVTTTWSSYETDALVEMSGHGVTKASTLAAYCEEHGISRDEVVAFGDMPNDLPLLKWAGTSYAMANAHTSVFPDAAHTAPSNDEDGVAVVLEELFGL